MPKKSPREKDLTRRYASGELEGDDANDTVQRFSARSKNHQSDKTAKTSAARSDALDEAQLAAMPIGKVIQVHSLYLEVSDGSTLWLCTARKTINQVLGGDIVVGDQVRLQPSETTNESGRPAATIEHVLPRKTVLTRADSFKQQVSHPIVANADQMLIVGATLEPAVKWGLIDRMLIAAQSGGLIPIICLNKSDLLADSGQAVVEPDTSAGPTPQEALAHYATLGIQTLQTSVIRQVGLTQLQTLLTNKTTVLAGHSGVGKSSLISAIQPSLDLRVANISAFTGKGRHTTTSSRIYPLDNGGSVIDTPGVKVFGLWKVTRDDLDEYFPDVANSTAPSWRVESYERLVRSLAP